MTTKRLGDLPFVFMSYDEPWADEYWRDLKQKVPHAKRVHGIKGLDACHKAAADAVPGNWVVTVDADTIVDAQMADVRVPKHLLNDQYRLDWLARNSVNGLWTGNGSLKLWPKRIIKDMRTHEAAPDDALSVDHDIGGVIPGQSGQLTMPERLAETSPAKTAYQAFRCGFREAVFLYQMALNEKQRLGLPSFQDASVMRILRIWCSIGRHAHNGLWVTYGARLGLAIPHLMDEWDPRLVNDYARLDKLWDRQIRPNFEIGACQSWNWEKLDAECRALAGFLLSRLNLKIEEFSNRQSQALAEFNDLSPTTAASRHDALGYRLMIKAKTGDELQAAKHYLEVSRFLGHPSAYNNMGLVCLNDLNAQPSKSAALWNFQAAEALGNSDCRLNAKKLLKTGKYQSPPAKRATEYPIICLYDPEIEAPDTALPVQWAAQGSDNLHDVLSRVTDKYCFIFDPQVRPTPTMANHIPVPDLCADGVSVSYARACATTGRVELGGISFVTTEMARSNAEAQRVVSMPVLLGKRAEFQTEDQAIAAAQRDAELVSVKSNFLTIGKDAPFGKVYVFVLLTLITQPDDVRQPIKASHATDQNIESLLETLSMRIDEPSMSWAAPQSKAFKSLLLDIPPDHVWKVAAESLKDASNGSDNWSDVVLRTSRSVWGMK